MDVMEKSSSEKRMIDSDEARRRIIAFATGLHSEVLPVDTVMMLLIQMPAVDAVEVVRCTDCTHRFKDSWCEYADDDDNFYCARGQRKDGAD